MQAALCTFCTLFNDFSHLVHGFIRSCVYFILSTLTTTAGAHRKNIVLHPWRESARETIQNDLLHFGSRTHHFYGSRAFAFCDAFSFRISSHCLATVEDPNVPHKINRHTHTEIASAQIQLCTFFALSPYGVHAIGNSSSASRLLHHFCHWRNEVICTRKMNQKKKKKREERQIIISRDQREGAKYGINEYMHQIETNKNDICHFSRENQKHSGLWIITIECDVPRTNFHFILILDRRNASNHIPFFLFSILRAL